LPGGQRVACRSALVEAGIEHVFDPAGEQVALMYLEPDAPEVRRLRPLLAREGGVVVDPLVPGPVSCAVQRRLENFDLDALLRGGAGEAPPLDARVLRALQLVRALRDRPLARAEAAGHALLSSSRFNHLFRAQAGVSFRSYRVWAQVRCALTGLGPRLNLTDAALQGAFSDASHFSRTFRATFGMTPSSVLKPLRQVRVLGAPG
jgi:AraC-like DNA-binding protein